MSPTGSRGFTLVEVLVASLVLAIALLGIATMSLASLGQLARSNEDTHATALAQTRIEILRNEPYTSSLLAAGTTVETLTADWTGYTRTTVIQNDTPMAGMKQIRVTITAPSSASTEMVALRVDQ